MGLVSPASAVVWTVQPTPLSGYMAGVSCVSARACLAVGEVGYKGPAGAMGWDGRRWTPERVPDPGPGGDMGVLSGVSCTSTSACIAVGQYTGDVSGPLPMAVGWDGVGWSLLAAPNLPSSAAGGWADGVSCVLSSACMAVGVAFDESGIERPLADWWDGSSWSVESMPSPAAIADMFLNSVSCTSSSACTAIGGGVVDGGGQLFAERWDGSSWSLQSMPRPAGAIGAQLSQVSCTSPSACVAVGFYTTSEAQFFSGTLIERWNGVNWSIHSTPGALVLTGVSCSSSSACTAVGSAQSTGGYVPSAERWDGSRWTLHRLPGGAALSAVSCSSSEMCTVLGTDSGHVSAYRSAPASAKLTGVRAGCASAPFTLRVTGLGIASVTWRLDSRRIKGRSIHPGTRYAARFRLTPGRHMLSVEVKFEASSQTHSRAFRRILLGCSPVR